MMGISIWSGGQFSPSLLECSGFLQPSISLSPPVSAKKMVRIPAHTAQMQDQSDVLVLARQKRARADTLSASLQLGGLHSDAGLVWHGSICRLSRALFGDHSSAAAVKLCR